MRQAHDAALSYADIGWAALPLHSPAAGGCTCRKAANCGSAGKHPRTAHGVKDASPDPATIRGWWQRWPAANVGIATGKASGLLALDIDPRHGGDEAIDALVQRHGRLPDSVESLTGGGGRHLLFRYPPDATIGNSAGRLGPGLDIRGDGGFIVVPPSLHASGRRYQWEASSDPADVPVANPPDWLVELASQETRHTTQERPRAPKNTQDCVSAPERSCVVSLTDAISQTMPDAPGHRNRHVFAFARRLRGMPAYRELPVGHPKLRDAVRQWYKAALPNIGTDDVDVTIDDFDYCWRRVKFPVGAGLDVILAPADKIELPGWAADYAETTRRLIRVCIILQRKAGDESFYLGCRDAGRQAGMDYIEASRRLGRLVRDGVLELVERGERPMASSYRYVGREGNE